MCSIPAASLCYRNPADTTLIRTLSFSLDMVGWRHALGSNTLSCHAFICALLVVTVTLALLLVTEAAVFLQIVFTKPKFFLHRKVNH